MNQGRNTEAALLALSCALAACNGTTGDQLISFTPVARGSASARLPFTPTESPNYSITLTKATMHIGALYVNASPPQSSSAATPCYNSSVVVAEVPSWIDLDLLNPTAQPWAGPGYGSADLGLSYQLWFTSENSPPVAGGAPPGGDITAANSPASQPPTLAIQAKAVNTTTEETFTFGVVLRIDTANGFAPAAVDLSTPGVNPICAARIVSFGAAGFSVPLRSSSTGRLTLTIDPTHWFDRLNLDDPNTFRATTADGNCLNPPGQTTPYSGDDGMYAGTDRCIPDDYGNASLRLVYSALGGSGNYYTLNYTTSP